MGWLALSLACTAPQWGDDSEIGSDDDSAAPAAETCPALVVKQVASWEGMEIPQVSQSDSSWPGAAVGDVTGDGLPDVVAAFAGGATLFRNLGAGEWNAELLNVQGLSAPASRSVALADLDDGDLDLFVTDVRPPHLLLNNGTGLYADATLAMNAYVPATSTNLVSWGAAFVDLDSDSWDDIVVSYGGLDSNVDVTQLQNADPTWTDSRDQASLLLRNQGGKTFERDDAAFTDVAQARGIAVGDLDLDGRPDLVLVGKLYLHLFRTTGGYGPGVTLAFRGPPSNRNGFGAHVDAVAAGHTATRWMLPSVTAGQSALEVYVGTGMSGAADITVTWPGGAVTEVGELAAGSHLTVAWDA